jgi:acetyl-CoA carboxylase carboxyl transferase subunit beta
MPPDGWFRKKSKFPHLAAAHGAAQIPEGVATKCARCGQILFTKDFEKNLKVCPHCGFHHKLTAAERIAYTVDDGTWREFAQHLRSVDTLHFKDYAAKLEKLQSETGLTDGVLVGTAEIDGLPLILGVTDFRFIGGSMGSVAGEKIVRAVDEAISRRLPFVVFTTSGGARMQEGLLSLMQMAKTSAACARLAEAKLPYIVVMTDPTMAGVLASYASLGDIHLAEPGATIGFAGARVAAQAGIQKPPADYQTAEWQLAQGHIDQIVSRRDLPQALSTLLRLLTHAATSVTPASYGSAEAAAMRNGYHVQALAEAAVG